MGRVNILSWEFIRVSMARQSYVVAQYFWRAVMVGGGTPSLHALSLGRSRPGGILAVSTRCVMKLRRFSGTSILNGVGWDILLIVIRV